MKRPLAILLLTAAASAADEGWHLLPEPRFGLHALAWPVEGSRDMVVVPVRRGDADVVPLDPAAIAADSALTREALLASARANAASLLDTLPVDLVRDPRGVILYAVIASEDPLTASAVFAPDFASRFRETIGPDPLVAVPNRYTLYVFPRSAQPPGLADMVFTAYGVTNHPVSREVFEIRDGGPRPIGTTR